MKQPDYTKEKYWKYESKCSQIKDKYFNVINENEVVVVSFGRTKKKGVSPTDVNPSVQIIKMISFITNYNYYSKVFGKRRCNPITKKEFNKSIKQLTKKITQL